MKITARVQSVTTARMARSAMVAVAAAGERYPAGGAGITPSWVSMEYMLRPPQRSLA
jgi:hypothetical protein